MVIPPSLRERRRYIAFKVVARPVFTPNQVIQGIKQSVLQFLGELGYADANFEIVDYNHKNGTGIARTTDKKKDEVLIALTLLNTIQGKKASIRILGISGTVKKAKEKFLANKENLFKGDNPQIYEENRGD